MLNEDAIQQNPWRSGTTSKWTSWSNYILSRYFFDIRLALLFSWRSNRCSVNRSRFNRNPNMASLGVIPMIYLIFIPYPETFYMPSHVPSTSASPNWSNSLVSPLRGVITVYVPQSLDYLGILPDFYIDFRRYRSIVVLPFPTACLVLKTWTIFEVSFLLSLNPELVVEQQAPHTHNVGCT